MKKPILKDSSEYDLKHGDKLQINEIKKILSNHVYSNIQVLLDKSELIKNDFDYEITERFFYRNGIFYFQVEIYEA